MKPFCIYGSMLVAGVAALLSGCGGGGGGSSSGGNGGGSSTFSGQISITGGKSVNTTLGGTTQDVQVKDINGAVSTLPSVFSPAQVPAQIPVTVIKSGSNLFSGHYTSNTATYIDPITSATIPVPLTSGHKLAQDTLVVTGGWLVLPIDKIGPFSFPNGIKVRVATTFNAVQLAALTFSGEADLGDGNFGTASTTLTFNGVGSPTGAAAMVFQGTGSISVPSNAIGNSPFTVTGQTTGASKEFPTAEVGYEFRD